MYSWADYGGSVYGSVKGFSLLGIHLGALAVFWPGLFAWPALAAAAVVLYATVALGISLCFHRVLTHRSLRLFKPFEYLLAIFGTLALQGDPIRWVAVHRKHHAHADEKATPTASVADSAGHMWSGSTGTTSRYPTDEEMLHFAPDLYAQPFYRVMQYLNIPLSDRASRLGSLRSADGRG